MTQTYIYLVFRMKLTLCKITVIWLHHMREGKHQHPVGLQPIAPFSFYPCPTPFPGSVVLVIIQWVLQAKGSTKPVEQWGPCRKVMPFGEQKVSDGFFEELGAILNLEEEFPMWWDRVESSNPSLTPPSWHF